MQEIQVDYSTHLHISDTILFKAPQNIRCLLLEKEGKKRKGVGLLFIFVASLGKKSIVSAVKTAVTWNGFSSFNDEKLSREGHNGNLSERHPSHHTEDSVRFSPISGDSLSNVEIDGIPADDLFFLL